MVNEMLEREMESFMAEDDQGSGKAAWVSKTALLKQIYLSLM